MQHTSRARSSSSRPRPGRGHVRRRRRSAPRTPAGRSTCRPRPGCARPGEAPGSFALESAIDELARACGIDPIELRPATNPTPSPASGLPFSSRNLIACFREGARRFGWADRDPRPGLRRDGRWLLGTGVAAAAPIPAGRSLHGGRAAEADGTFTVRINATDIGTGARTALTLIAADALDAPTDRVRTDRRQRPRPGDHRRRLDGHPLLGLGGHGRPGAAGDWPTLRRRVPPEGMAPVGRHHGGRRALAAKERHSFGAQFAEVPVDATTGEVRVRRMLGIFAAGRIVNPLTARNQFIGGMTMGLSMALHESGTPTPVRRLRRPRPGRLPRAAHADVPPIEADWVDDHDHQSTRRGKGIGEIGIVGAAAAIANAVCHATGVRHRNLPIRHRRPHGGRGARCRRRGREPSARAARSPAPEPSVLALVDDPGAPRGAWTADTLRRIRAPGPRCDVIVDMEGGRALGRRPRGPSPGGRLAVIDGARLPGSASGRGARGAGRWALGAGRERVGSGSGRGERFAMAVDLVVRE